MVRVFPLVLPYGQGLDQDAGFQKNVVSDVGQRQLSVEKRPLPPMEQDGHVGITVGAVIAPHPAAEENGPFNAMRTRYAL